MKLLLVTGHKISHALPAYDHAPIHFGRKVKRLKA
jgi:hypothetical protein